MRGRSGTPGHEQPPAMYLEPRRGDPPAGRPSGARSNVGGSRFPGVALALRSLHPWLPSAAAPRLEFYPSIDTHTISLSFRTNTHLFANAGWHQTTSRPEFGWVGSMIFARLSSLYPLGTGRR